MNPSNRLEDYISASVPQATNWPNDIDIEKFYELKKFNSRINECEMVTSSSNCNEALNNSDQSVVLIDDTTADPNKAHDNLNFETDDVELDLAWFDSVSKSNHLHYFCGNETETIDVSDSLVSIESDKSVNVPGQPLFSKMNNTDKNKTVAGKTYKATDDTYSFFDNVNINDLNIHIESDDCQNQMYKAHNFNQEYDTVPGAEQLNHSFDMVNETEADLLNKTFDMSSDTEANLLNDTFDTGSETEAVPLNRTFDMGNETEADLLNKTFDMRSDTEAKLLNETFDIGSDTQADPLNRAFDMGNETEADLLNKTFDMRSDTEANLLNETFDIGSDTQADPLNRTFEMENETEADLLNKSNDMRSDTEANLLNETFEVGSDTQADPLNRTFDILNIENMELSLDLASKQAGGNEKSTLDNDIGFLEHRENEDICSVLTYVIESKTNGSVEVEIDCGFAADIADFQKINQKEEIVYESESDVINSETDSDYCGSDVMHELSSHFAITPLGSNNYRDNKGYVYTKNNSRKGNLYLRCKHSVKYNCKSRVTVRDNNFQQPHMTIKHSHPHDASILDKSIFDKKLEQNIKLDPFETPRQLYLKTKTDLLDIIDAANIPPLKKKEGFIYRRQKKYIPRLPTTIEDFEKFISDEKYHKYFSNDHRGLPFYRGIWSSAKGERNLVYISETLLKWINTMNNIEFFIDGTFKALPHHLQFRQLYVISVTFNNQCYPLAYIFMEKKTFTSYDCVFENLKLLMPSVEVTKVMSDYEAATRKALKKHYPDARISGCFFHYVQAIIKSTKRFGLRREAKFKDAIKKLCMLALLPNDFVLKGFQCIDEKFKKKSKRWTAFKKYWMKQWEPANISVYGLVNRSNNFSESNNKSLNLLLKRRHPNIWILIMNLKLLEMDKSDLIKRAKKGEMVSTKRNRDMVRLNEKIKNATELFEEDQDIEMFLKRVTFEENVELFVKDQVDIMDDDDGLADEGFDDDIDEEVIPNYYNNESDFRKNHPRVAAMPKTAEKTTLK